MTFIKIAKNANPEKKKKFLIINFLISSELDFNPGKVIIIKIKNIIKPVYYVASMLNMNIVF